MTQVVTLVTIIQEVAEFFHGYPQSLQASDGTALTVCFHILSNLLLIKYSYCSTLYEILIAILNTR